MCWGIIQQQVDLYPYVDCNLIGHILLAAFSAPSLFIYMVLAIGHPWVTRPSPAINR
jgi:hypothetical protein